MLKKTEHMWRKLGKHLSLKIFVIVNSVMPFHGTVVGNSSKTCELRSCHLEFKQTTAEKEKEEKKIIFAWIRSSVQYTLLHSDLITAADALLRLAAFLFFTDKNPASLQAVSGRRFWLAPTLSAVSLSEHSESRASCSITYLSVHPTLISLCRRDRQR